MKNCGFNNETFSVIICIVQVAKKISISNLYKHEISMRSAKLKMIKKILANRQIEINKYQFYFFFHFNF